MKNKAFTLIELMVVMGVIAIISAILLPIALKSAPDENVMKFKKANITLGTAINDLISNETYYINGDLGTDSNNQKPSAKHFCQSFAGIMSTKSVNCSSACYSSKQALIIGYGAVTFTTSNKSITVTQEHINSAKSTLDTVCKNAASTIGAEIVTTDNISYYQACPSYGFGELVSGVRAFSSPVEIPANWHDQNGYDNAYKILCIDIDGLNNGEDPFGYGIRADGKILYGARADEWTEKSIQQKE